MSKIKNFKEYVSWQITISDYLVRFYNYPDDVHKKFTHDDVKKHLPFIKRIKCLDVTREQICTGEVILVKDIMGKVLAYQNPFAFEEYNEVIDYIKENENISICEESFEKDEEYFETETIKSMNCYELRKKMENAKKSKNYKIYNLLRKELCSRKNSNEKKEKVLKKIKVKEERMMLDD